MKVYILIEDWKYVKNAQSNHRVYFDKKKAEKKCAELDKDDRLGDMFIEEHEVIE